MRNLITPFFLVFTLLCDLKVYSQAEPILPDTFEIYESKAGVKFSNYMHVWFWDYGWRNSYGWPIRDMNGQDSLVLKDSKQPRYFIVYDKKNRRRFEGLADKHRNLSGDIKFYYKTGQLKRIEHWAPDRYELICGDFDYDPYGNEMARYDGLQQRGRWTYFRRNGKTKKTREHFREITSCEPFVFRSERITTRYFLNGKVKFKTRKKI